MNEGDEVDKGGEEQVDGVFVGEIWLELGLGTNLHKVTDLHEC